MDYELFSTSLSWVFLARMIVNIFSIFLFSYSIGLLELNFIENIEIFVRFLKKRQNAKENELIELDKQMRQIEKQMSELSPTVDFAKYFKCERLLKKRQEEHDTIEKFILSNSFSISLKWNLAIRSIFFLSSLLLASYSTDIYFTIDNCYFYPLISNFPIQFIDRILAKDNNSELQSGLQKITIFDFCIMALLVRNIYAYRRKSQSVYK